MESRRQQQAAFSFDHPLYLCRVWHLVGEFLYPVPAGSFVTDIPNTIHWDGAKEGTEPCILLLVGVGPMVTTGYTQKDPNSPVFTPPEPK
jgi:hypothetical protein